MINIKIPYKMMYVIILSKIGKKEEKQEQNVKTSPPSANSLRPKTPCLDIEIKKHEYYKACFCGKVQCSNLTLAHNRKH